MNSPRQRDDINYLHDARRLATVVQEMLQLERFSSLAEPLPAWDELTVLDFGCGTCRLVTGLDLVDRWPAEYIGVDVQPGLIEWANEAVAPLGKCSFHLLEMQNQRYNPDGLRDQQRILPDVIRDIDLIVCRSIFTHMISADIARSLHEFRRVIAPGGRAYVTVNVRNGVPAWTDNPGVERAPNLLRVELNKGYFENIVEDSGFRCSAFLESVENQSGYLLRPA